MVEPHAAYALRPYLDDLREALTAVANGDSEPMKALCSHVDAVSQCGFWGGVERAGPRSASAGGVSSRAALSRPS